jgi:hypothetical protein
MRRVWLAAAVLALVGCDKLREAFVSRPEVAAEAGGEELKVERLASLLNSLKGVPVSAEAARFVADIWVDHMLFAQALAGGRALDDSATAARVLWPELAEIKGTRWHDTLMARRAPPGPGLGDSVYRADQVRVLQHILFRAEPTAEPKTREAARRKAEQALSRLRHGVRFGFLATQLSEDPGSKLDQGYLPPAPRGRWVTAFDSAGWLLPPGGMTGVVESPFGFHIIRRPPVEEVRDRLAGFARERLGAVLDSLYLDSLGIERGLRIEPEAPQAMRAALVDRDAASRSTRALATYRGGKLTVAGFIKWVNALGPGFAAQLQAGNDTALVHFARAIAQNTLLLEQADSAGIGVEPDEWASLVQRYRARLDTLRMQLDLYGSDLTDPAAPAAQRLKVAALKIASHWDRVAESRSRPRPIPPALGAVLREGAAYRIYPAGVERAARLAQELRLQASGDTLRPPGPPARGPTSPPPADTTGR